MIEHFVLYILNFIWSVWSGRICYRHDFSDFNGWKWQLIFENLAHLIASLTLISYNYSFLSDDHVKVKKISFISNISGITFLYFLDTKLWGQFKYSCKIEVKIKSMFVSATFFYIDSHDLCLILDILQI